MINSRKRGEYAEISDIVLDCSGLDRRLGLATGGGQACGESSLRAIENDEAVHQGMLTKDAVHQLGGKRIILFGGGLEACINAQSRAAGGLRTTDNI